MSSGNLGYDPPEYKKLECKNLQELVEVVEKLINRLDKVSINNQAHGQEIDELHEKTIKLYDKLASNETRTKDR